MGLKAAARAILPDPVVVAITARAARRHSHALNRKWGITELSERLMATLGPEVQAGPFKGLVLPRAAAAEHLGPYLLGTYERELHDYWSSLAMFKVPLVINVGAKFGYYAVGLARKLQTRGVAYDPDRWARRVLEETIALNGVDVQVRGRCRRGDLRDLPPGTLVVIDCDGCEEALLRDPLPPGLAQSRLVVELHGVLVEEDQTARRLTRTHDVVTVPSLPAPPVPSDLTFLDDHQRKLAVEEIRTPQRWLLCTPRVAPRPV